jgi:hypothetical protein
LAAVNGPTANVPDMARLPVQAPLETQLVALALLQVSVELLPLATLVGDAANDNVGAAVGCCTTTAALAEPVPPVPVQERVNVEFADSGPTLCVPFVAFDPDHAPDAVQLVALVADQVSFDDAPAATDVGFALNVTTGAPGGGGVVVGGVVVVPTSTVVLDEAVPPKPTHARP